MDAFLRDFDMYFCKLFDGARHDSGDPFTWGERLLTHYEVNRADPRTKTLVLSDSLTVPRAIELAARFSGPCKVSFGIGTNLNNAVSHEPLTIVMTMIRLQWHQVETLSHTTENTKYDEHT